MDRASQHGWGWGRQVTANKSSALVQVLASSRCLAERIYYAPLLSRFSRFRLSVTPWTVARKAPLAMGFSREEYWSGLLCPPPGECPNPGIEPGSLTSLALAGGFFTTSAAWEVLSVIGLSKSGNAKMLETRVLIVKG